MMTLEEGVHSCCNNRPARDGRAVFFYTSMLKLSYDQPYEKKN